MIRLPQPISELIPEGVPKGEVMLIEGNPSTGIDLVALNLMINLSNEKVVCVEFGDRVNLKLRVLLKLAEKSKVFSELIKKIKLNTVIIRFSNFIVEFEDFNIESLPFKELETSISKFYGFVKENDLSDAVFIFSGFEEAILMWDVYEILKQIASLKNAMPEATFLMLIDDRSMDSLTLSLLEGLSTTIVKLESSIDEERIVRKAYLIKSFHSTVSKGIIYSLDELLKVD